MKKNIKISFTVLLFALILSACDGLIPDSKIDTLLRDDQASVSYDRLKSQGISMYDYIPEGYDRISGAMFASACDEADFAIPGSSISRFVDGSWNAIVNPDDVWASKYRGIRMANLFLENSTDYQTIILRDTANSVGAANYQLWKADIEYLRNEAMVIKAYCYFELIKRYGGVPLITEAVSVSDDVNLPRSSYDEVVVYILQQLNSAIPNLQENWSSYQATSFGRISKGMAMALKSRVLLYWASPLNNPNNNLDRWKQAAQAAHDVITYGKYSLESNYGSLFVGDKAHKSNESIFAYATGSNNTPEKTNYPISTNSGSTGNCPSGNLVDDYEYKTGEPFSWTTLAPGADPYANRDPRLTYSVVVNNSTWTNRTIECWVGGKDGEGTRQTSTTGYYLKKFLTDKLDLSTNKTAVHSWILFRYGEILLNYAEAMNEAYGPDTDFFGDGYTARWAINQIRTRATMPAVVAANTQEMRAKIKHERRIELAFEEHRQWDVRRWGINDAKAALGATIKGIRITKTESGFTYVPVTVGNRVFNDYNILYPIPQSEILLSNGVLTQNPQY